MKTTKKNLCMLILCALTCFISCDKGNEKEGDSKLTPDEHKVEIENIGKKFVASFNAAENEVIVKSLHSLNGLLFDENSNFSDLFNPIKPNPQVKPTKILRNTLNSIISVITKNDIQALISRVSNVEEMSLRTGIYTHNGTIWSKSDTPDKLELKYDQNSVLTITYSDITSYTNIEGFIIDIPQKVTITLKVGEQEVLNYMTTFNLSDGQKTVDANIDLILSTHYKWNAEIDVNASKGTLKYKMTVRDAIIMAATADLTGNNLTTPDNYGGETYPDGLFGNATLVFQVMNLELKGSADVNAITLQISNDEGYPEGDEAASEAYAKEWAQNYNGNTELAIYYTADNAKIADIKFKADWRESSYVDNYDEYGNPIWKTWNEWDANPILVFASDNSEFAFEDYFTESNFSSFIEAVKILIGEFSALLAPPAQ